MTINDFKLRSIINYFKSGHERSIKAKRNIFESLLINGLSVLISLIFVPIVINYINPTRYGIWLTISSIIGWFTFFDIGLTQGLRNKFAEAVAQGDYLKANVYVSTTYAILGIVFFSVWLLFLFVNQFLNWANILNVSQEMRNEVTTLAIIVFTYFCISFVLRIVSTLLIALQKPARASLINLFGQIFSLILVVVLLYTTKESLILLAFVLCVAPVIVLFFSNYYFFRKDLKKYRPQIHNVKFRFANDLFNLGFKFFIIQVAGIIQFQTANIIIAQYFGSLEVTSYNIVYKYFSILSMVFSIFLSPFWSASTEAYIKKDIQWIKNGIKKYNQLNILMSSIGILMLFFSSYLYDLWLGKGVVEISFALTFWGFLYFNVYMFGSKYVNFLNGINALRIQFYASLASPIVYLGTSILFIEYFNMGVYSLFAASIFANFNAIFIAPLQYYNIIVKNKTGIWIK